MLSERTQALETCGYCPKLCRAACPVSTAEASETVTPWGKMSLSWLMSRGDLPVDAAHASHAWACSGCYACRERCDHSNPVAPTLMDARADYFTAGVAPAQATRVVHEHEARVEGLASVQSGFEGLAGDPGAARRGLLLGCAYVSYALDEARDAVKLTRALLGDVRLVSGCCGQPLAHAGDKASAEQEATSIASQLAGLDELVVLDPGCAMSLVPALEAKGISMRTLISVADDHRERLQCLPELAGKLVRFHDPCQLGRGLGIYEPPRRVLERLLGAPPEEFSYARELGACSGAGGLLPVTRPDTSKKMAAARLEEHHALGDGVVVTGCASSLQQFRGAGANALDLVSLAYAGLGSS